MVMDMYGAAYMFMHVLDHLNVMNPIETGMLSRSPGWHSILEGNNIPRTGE